MLFVDDDARSLSPEGRSRRRPLPRETASSTEDSFCVPTTIKSRMTSEISPRQRDALNCSSRLQILSNLLFLATLLLPIHAQQQQQLPEEVNGNNCNIVYGVCQEQVGLVPEKQGVKSTCFVEAGYNSRWGWSLDFQGSNIGFDQRVTCTIMRSHEQDDCSLDIPTNVRGNLTIGSNDVSWELAPAWGGLGFYLYVGGCPVYDGTVEQDTCDPAPMEIYGRIKEQFPMLSDGHIPLVRNMQFNVNGFDQYANTQPPWPVEGGDNPLPVSTRLNSKRYMVAVARICQCDAIPGGCVESVDATLTPTGRPTNSPSFLPTGPPVVGSTSMPTEGPATAAPTIAPTAATGDDDGSSSAAPTTTRFVRVTVNNCTATYDGVTQLLTQEEIGEWVNLTEAWYNKVYANAEPRRFLMRELQETTNLTDPRRAGILNFRTSIAFAGQELADSGVSTTIYYDQTLEYEPSPFVEPESIAQPRELIELPYRNETTNEGYSGGLKAALPAAFATLETPISTPVVPDDVLIDYAPQEENETGGTPPAGTLSTGGIVGIGLAAVATVAVLGIFVLYMVRRRKDQTHDPSANLTEYQSAMFRRNDMLSEAAPTASSSSRPGSLVRPNLPSITDNETTHADFTETVSMADHHHHHVEPVIRVVNPSTPPPNQVNGAVVQGSGISSEAASQAGAEQGAPVPVLQKSDSDNALGASVGTASGASSGGASDYWDDSQLFEIEAEESSLIFEIDAPPGKLGVLIDTPKARGIPIVHTVKEESVLRGIVQVGDVLVAVDGRNVTRLNARNVSKLLYKKQARPVRKLKLVRAAADEAQSSTGDGRASNRQVLKQSSLSELSTI